MNTTHQSRKKYPIIHPYFLSIGDAMGYYDLGLCKKEATKRLLSTGYDSQYSGKEHGFYLSKPFNN